MAAANMDGTKWVYYEIFHETSNGDFGIEPLDGPLLRCHTHILQKVPGFLGKVRLGKPLSRTVEDDGPTTSKDYFKKNGLTRMFEDATFVQFSQPIMHSALKGGAPFGQAPIDPLMPGYTTATLLSGDTGATRRVNQFFLAERYEVDCDVERLCELLRYIYQGYTSYFDIKPRTDTERTELTYKMLYICQDAERFSVDALFEKVLAWFGRESYWIVGEKNFANAFYHLQHFEARCTEDHSRRSLISTVTGDMLASRHQFRAVTRDARWSHLPVAFVEGTLSYDYMPISSEIEVLNLIERWNEFADKPRDELIRLLGCFRPDQETQSTLETWLSGLGWLGADGTIADMPELGPLRTILGLDGKNRHRKKPRKNLRGAALQEAQQEEAQGAAEDREKSEGEVSFVHYKGNVMIAKGCSFSIGSGQRLVQSEPIRTSGIQRVRVVLSNPKRVLWDPDHQVFVGISYGKGRYFGYLCSATAFSGIFSVRALASAAPEPNAPVHLTGSGNKVAFDIALEVQLQRVNLVVTCKLSIIFANETVTEELFQISSETLLDGTGLRYQCVATNLRDEEVHVSINLVSGGGTDESSGPGAD
eukprot:TRINITY_DN37809_c0_g1_i1.p1 TRINITY_DN37809_c0_g1~~TRINITY_DN37809_c0_g1_i1.p1  ORF type:complete len:612 (-),score=100.34 TRINITY_DN37809_c0_g1_i1:154-1923(-)